MIYDAWREKVGCRVWGDAMLLLLTNTCVRPYCIIWRTRNNCYANEILASTIWIFKQSWKVVVWLSPPLSKTDWHDSLKEKEKHNNRQKDSVEAESILMNTLIDIITSDSLIWANDLLWTVNRNARWQWKEGAGWKHDLNKVHHYDINYHCKEEGIAMYVEPTDQDRQLFMEIGSPALKSGVFNLRNGKQVEACLNLLFRNNGDTSMVITWMEK